jgi:serine protease inhibitor
MKTIYCILAVSLMLIISSCEINNDQPSENHFHITKNTEKLIAADNEFGIDLFKQVVAIEDEDSNVFISPISVSIALAMTYNGADGATKEAMEATLNKEGLHVEEINEIYRNLINGLLSVDPKVILEIANSIWYRHDFYVEDDFINVNKDYYDAEVNSLDFMLPDAKDIINGWVAEKTHDKIPEIIDFIHPNAVMYLINAIYFNGLWKYEFDEEDTEDDEFWLNDGSYIYVPTMIQQENFNYFSNDIFTAAELCYGQGNYSMIILVPQADKSVNHVIEELNSENWNLWLAGFQEEEIVIHLPKFRFEFSDSLNQPLINLGMGIAFTWDADFSKINPYKDLKISRVLHKTFVEVNEAGTEAAAVTAVEIIERVSGPGEQIIHFKVNKPFLFAIKEKETNAIIFIGKVMKPVWIE